MTARAAVSTVVMGIFLLLPLAARAQMDVWPEPIVQENVFQIPLWLVPFDSENDALRDRTQRIEQVIYTDLQFSGLFNIVRGKPTAIGMKPGNYSVQVSGRVWTEGNSEFFEGLVNDVASGDFLGGKKYNLRKGEERRVAHHFADEIVKLVTGNTGVATTQIAFTRKHADQWELLICDYDGYGPKVIVRQSVPLLTPRWVEHQRAVAYVSYREGKPDLYLRYLSEPKSVPIASYPGINYAVDWSQKEDLMIAALSKDGNSELYFLHKDGKLGRRLTYNRAIDTSPSWSPTGREIAFTSDRSGSPQIYIMDRDGSNVRRITFIGSYNASPAWSPRGDLIAFVSRIGNDLQIVAIGPDGRGGRLVTQDSNSHEDPRWAPDGRHLVFAEQHGNERSISVIDIVTGGKRILAQGASPDWSSP